MFIINIIPPDASDGRVPRQYRCRQEGGGRADWRRGRHARTHQPHQHRRSKRRSVTPISRWITLPPINTVWAKFHSRRLWSFRCDQALGADPGSDSEWQAQAQAEPAAVAAADVRSADHVGLAGSVWGWTQPAARAPAQHRHTHHPAEDQEAQGSFPRCAFQLLHRSSRSFSDTV